MMKEILILGAGQAGFQAAASLRDNGFEGRIRLVGNERELPYERPPLSKSYITGEKDRLDLELRPEKFYIDKKIDVLLNEHALSVDRFSRKVELRSGRRLSYDHLILALGAQNRHLQVPHESGGPLYLRTLADAEMVRQRLPNVHNVVIVGGGFIGLELAAALRTLGKRVHILEVSPQVIGRAISPFMSIFLKDAHTKWGNAIVTSVSVSQILQHSTKLTLVKTADGRTFEADLVLGGIGAVPNTQIALDAGLRVRAGIVVDSQLRTSDARISAIGDCAEFPSRFSDDLIRLESIQNAVDHARCVALRLVGKPTNYSSVPWFWSEQATLRLQIAGITAGCKSTVVRGRPSENKFSVFCFDSDRLLGVESINKPIDHMFGRRLLECGGSLTPQQAADEDFDLKSVLVSNQTPAPNTDGARFPTNS